MDAIEPPSQRGESEGRELLPLLVLYAIVPAVVAGLMLYYLLLSRQVVGEFGLPLDDGWIHARFAQNLAAGHGFSFNPGEPTSTTTGPLWTLLLGFAYRITGEHLFTAAALNWVICVLAALTAASLAQTLIPGKGFGALVALVVAVTVPLPWLALSGMEPPLFMWLTLLGILLHVRLRGARWPGAAAPTVVLALAALARPEGILLFPLAMLDRLAVATREGRGGDGVSAWAKQLAAHSVVLAAIVVPLFIYNYQVIGRPLPSSYYIKSMNYGPVMALAAEDDSWLAHALLVAPLKEFGSLLLMWAQNNLALIVPFLFGIFWLVRSRGATARPGHSSHLIMLVLIVQPLAQAVSTNFHRAPDFQGQRYAANLGPLYLIVGMAGTWWLLRRVPARLRRAALPAALALVLTASLARQPGFARLYAHNVSDITEMQVTMGRWVRDNLPDDSYICLNDVGAIAVITGCRVLDTQGLVSPEILACLTIESARKGTWPAYWHRVLSAEEPDYMVVVSAADKVPKAGQSPLFAEQLHMISNEDNITSSGPIIAAYRTAWCEHPLEGGAER